MTEYEITIKVTEKELEEAQFGSWENVLNIINKVLIEAKKKGYVPSN